MGLDNVDAPHEHASFYQNNGRAATYDFRNIESVDLRKSPGTEVVIANATVRVFTASIRLVIGKNRVTTRLGIGAS